MTRSPKVYGWVGFARGVSGRQQRIVVAARSLAEVRRLCDASPDVGWPGRDYLDESGSPDDLRVALSDPGFFFARPLNPTDGNEFVRLPAEEER